MSETNYSLPTTAPKQKLSKSEKDKEWGKQNVDYLIGLSNYNSFNSGSNYNSFFKKKLNYDLYNNIINEEDFSYVTNPYGLSSKDRQNFPAKLQNFNIITPKLNLLEGEEIKRPFNFRVVAINEDAISEVQEKKKQALLEYLESELVSSLQQQGINIQQPDAPAQTPEQIEKYSSYSINNMRELTANRLAEYLIKQQNLEYKFNKGFKDSLITAEEFYYIGIDNGEPICDVVNPLDFDYDKNPDLDFIEEGQWARHTKYMTRSEVIDSYGRELKDEEVEQLDSSNSNGNDPYSSSPVIYAQPDLTTDGRIGYIKVSRVEWKSMRKIGYLTYYDPETLEKQETIVDETYKAVKEKGEEVEWLWISEVWEGTRIGRNIYCRIQPKKVQFRSIDNPSKCKLGFVGAVYNGRNSVPTSLIDLVKHHQYLFNVFMYRLELEVAKAKGKKMVMDIAQIPRSQGIDIDKWMYYFDTTGLAFINSFEEGKGKFQGQTSAFNQFAGVDMSLSQSVGQYISLLEKIEDMASELMGVTRQRLGAISSSETVGGVERSVQQSSHVTEPLFYLHNEVKKNVLTQLIECSKVAYPEGKKLNYIMDDMSRTILTIDEGFVNADYGIFVTNSAKEVKALEDLKSLANQAISAGMISLREASTIISSQSLSQVENIIDQGEKKMQAEKQQEQEHQAQLQQQAEQAKEDLQMRIEDRLDQRVVLKGEIDKEVSYIKTFGGKNASPEDDSNNNEIPDVLEYTKLSQEMLKHRDNMALEEKHLNLENKKLEVQQKIADAKNKVDMAKANKPSKS